MPYVFTPPTYKRMGYDDAWHRRTHIDVGIALVKRGLSYTQAVELTAEDYDTAVAIYMGGRSYVVDAAEGEQLKAAGYGAYLAPTTPIPDVVVLIFPGSATYPDATLYPQEL